MDAKQHSTSIGITVSTIIETVRAIALTARKKGGSTTAA